MCNMFYYSTDWPLCLPKFHIFLNWVHDAPADFGDRMEHTDEAGTRGPEDSRLTCIITTASKTGQRCSMVSLPRFQSRRSLILSRPRSPQKYVSMCVELHKERFIQHFDIFQMISPIYNRAGEGLSFLQQGSEYQPEARAVSVGALICGNFLFTSCLLAKNPVQLNRNTFTRGNPL